MLHRNFAMPLRPGVRSTVGGGLERCSETRLQTTSRSGIRLMKIFCCSTCQNVPLDVRQNGSMELRRSPSPPPEQGLVTIVHDRTMQGRWILAIACTYIWPPSPPPMVGLVTLVHGHSASFSAPHGGFGYSSPRLKRAPSPSARCVRLLLSTPA